jgi:hypothetical protein
MSEGLRNSVSGEEDIVFSSSPNAISADVKEFPGPGTCDASRTRGIPTRTGVCELGDPRTSGGCGVLPDLAASPCCTACVELCTCVPADDGSGEDGLRGSGSLFLGPKVGISSGVLKSSKGIRDGVEFVSRARACLEQSLGERNTPTLRD